MKHLVYFFSLTILFISCKENASSKIDANAKAVSLDYMEDNRPLDLEENLPERENLPEIKNGKYPIMVFEKETHDFGEMKEGETKSYDFWFTNTGESDLILLTVNASCGCTTPYYDKAPIKPGKRGKITAEFDSSGKPGKQSKNINISNNTKEGSQMITIQANVKSKD
jgi:hypothetical protein